MSVVAVKGSDKDLLCELRNFPILQSLSALKAPFKPRFEAVSRRTDTTNRNSVMDGIPYEHLPPDPAHEYYLKFCYVCQESAKPGQEHIRNYGGIVCFSCRQFFRRAHQKTKDPTFSCTFGGNCLVTVKSRRRCQKCRYDRCIFSGMVPSAVLTDEEKSFRFRKFRQKKKAKQMGLDPAAGEDKSSRKRGSGTRETLDTTDDDSDEEPSFEHGAAKRFKTEPVSPPPPPPLLPLRHDSQFHQPHHPHHKYQQHHYRHHQAKPLTSSTPKAKRLCTGNRTVDPPRLPADYDEPYRAWPALMNSKIELIVQRYHMTLSQMQSEISEELFFKLEAIQSGDMTVAITKSEIFEHLSQVAKQFHHFALLQSQFTKLRKKDQRQLLARNTPLYIQLYLSFYFSTPKGSQLLEVIHSTSRSPTARFDHNCRMFQQWFQAMNMIFRSGANVQYYAQLFASLCALRLNCAKVRAVLTYIILFDFDPKMGINDAFVLEDMSILNEIMLMSCVRKYHSSFAVENLVTILSQMAVFGANNVDWKRKGTICLRQRPNVNSSVRFSRDEQGSLELRMRQIDAASYSVTHNEDSLREFLLYFVGIQPTINVFVNTVRVFQERVWRILSIHPEFSGLTQGKKREIWQRSIPMGVAFMFIKKENASKGIDQLREEYGCLSDQQFEKFFRSLFACPGKVKKMWYQKSFIQQLEIGFRKLDLQHVIQNQNDPRSQSLIRMCSAVKNDLVPFLADPVLERLILVLSITQPCRESLPEAHENFLKYLWQHITSRGNALDSWTTAKSTALYSKVIHTLDRIQKMAELLKHFY